MTTRAPAVLKNVDKKCVLTINHFFSFQFFVIWWRKSIGSVSGVCWALFAQINLTSAAEFEKHSTICFHNQINVTSRRCWISAPQSFYHEWFFRSLSFPSGHNSQFRRYLMLLCFTWERLHLKLIIVDHDHADHNLSSVSLHVLLKKGLKVCFKVWNWKKLGGGTCFKSICFSFVLFFFYFFSHK